MVIIETERLLLLTLEEKHADFIFILLNNPTWLQFIGDRNIKTHEDSQNYLLNGPLKSYIENGFGLWLVETKDQNTPIGMCGLIKRNGLEHVDIGFALLPGYTGKGYAYEIAVATMNYAKNNLQLEQVVAITSPENVHSIKLLNRIGLRFEKMITLPGEEKAVMYFCENKVLAK